VGVGWHGGILDLGGSGLRKDGRFRSTHWGRPEIQGGINREKRGKSNVISLKQGRPGKNIDVTLYRPKRGVELRI